VYGVTARGGEGGVEDGRDGNDDDITGGFDACVGGRGRAGGVRQSI